MKSARKILCDNWFRAVLLLVLLLLVYVIYSGFVLIPEQNLLAKNQDVCREAGLKNDQKANDDITNTKFVAGYYFSSDLNTCLEAYTDNINTSSNVEHDDQITEYAIVDLYNDDAVLTCDNEYFPSKQIYDVETIRENKNGIYSGTGDNVVFKGKDPGFAICAKYTGDITGGRFVAGESF